MKKNFALALAAALLVSLVWFLWPRHDEASSPTATAGPALSTSAPSKIVSSETTGLPNPQSKIPPPAAAEVSHLADHLNAPTGDIRADLKIVANVLENFRTNFPHDGNPVGNNAEITAVLTGRNKLRYAAIPPNHPAINPAGELCDRWGTPFFFHAESAARMGIRSAGPDKKMWTADDIALEP